MVLALTLIVDSNILFASVIKDGVNAKLILSDRLHLIAPEKLFEEFERNRAVLVKRTHRAVEEFEKFLNVLEERIEVIPKSEFKPWLKEAKKKSPANDFPFTALAKAYGCSLWSNDRKIKACAIAVILNRVNNIISIFFPIIINFRDRLKFEI